MKQLCRSLGVAAILGALETPAFAQDKVRIGVVTTLTGPAAVLGQQLRDGFNLAVKDRGGKLGGREVEVVIADDEPLPDVAVTKVMGLIILVIGIQFVIDGIRPIALEILRSSRI